MGQLHSACNACHSLSRSSFLFIHRLIFGESKLFEQPKYHESAESLAILALQSLPVEILLHIFSFLELKSYLNSNGVCKEWRRLLPIADIHPARRRLFALYQNMINIPHFLNSRTWILDNLRPLDRQAYIDALHVQYPTIPEEFRIWILEWPARLAVACMWPGLPFIDCRRANAMRRYGVNWYKDDSPELLAVIYKQKTPDVKFVPGLLVWRAYTFTEWLIFDEDEPSLFGRVYVTDFMELESSAVIPHGRQPKPENCEYPEPVDLDPAGDHEFTERGPYDDAEEPVDSEGYLNVPYADWICYLEHQWALSVGTSNTLGNYIPIVTKLPLNQ